MQPLEFDCTYHIFNRANGNERLFLEEENYRFFLERTKLYLSPVSEILAYCLMPNHFHFLLRFKNVSKINQTDLKVKKLQDIPSRQLSKLLNSYAKSFNKKYNRKGSLFMRNAGRVKVEDEQYLFKLFNYIHFNPVVAGLAKKPEDWKYSSYKAIISQFETFVERDWVLEIFGDLENFKYHHKSSIE